jgi:O-antigen/teichoic acid export membrane protein
MKFMMLKQKITKLFGNQDVSRTSNVVKQIKFSFLFRLLAMGFNFLIIPITVGYLGNEQYGIWMTIITIMSWISFLDLGLGNGARNKITEALAQSRFDEVPQYISTGYIAIGILVGGLWCLLLVCSGFIDWSRAFNTSAIAEETLKGIFLSVSFLLFFNFLLSFTNQIINAYQKSSLMILNQLIANAVAFFLTFLAIKYTSSNLLLISVIYGSAPILSNVFIIWIFYKYYSDAKPSFRKFSMPKLKEMRGLSLNFLVLQLGTIVFMAKDNIVITQVLGPQYVTAFSVVNRIFGLLIITHGILLAPTWSAFTDAYTKGDFNWIKSIIKKLNILMIAVLLLVVILSLISPYLIKYWIGLEIDNGLIILTSIYTIMWIWTNNYVYFLNGIGALRISVLYTLVSVCFNIPLSVYLAKLYGVNGVLLASILCMLPNCILAPLQYYIIMNQKQVSKMRIINELFYR